MKFGKIILILLIAGLVLGGVWFLRRQSPKASTESRATANAQLDRVYTVKRADLAIGLLQGGYVNASKKHKLSLEANMRAKIIWVIPENTWVKKGDVLVKFETEDLVKQIEDAEIELENQKKELEIALEEEKILISTNAASIQSAEDSLVQAADALRKYRRFERKNTQNSYLTAITTAETALQAARTSYSDLRDSDLDSSADDPEEARRSELQTAQTKIDTASESVRSAEDKLKVFRRYDRPIQMTKLANAQEQSELNLRKVKISVNSSIIQKKRSIKNAENRIRMTQTQLERYRLYLTLMTLVAPVDGVVIYSDPDRNWGKLDVQPGLEVGRGQVIVTIPEMSNLVVDFDLPEQFRSKVKVGDQVIVAPDSLPNEKLSGKISEIATLPVNMVNWDASSPKIYKSRIALDEQSPKLVNGMSAQLHIISKIIKQTLFVPVEAVFEDNERFFVYLQTDDGYQERDVKIGDSNEHFVQILDGLAETDVVFLYRPFQKKQD